MSWMKRIFGQGPGDPGKQGPNGGGGSEAEVPETPRIPASKNPWHVELLDVRPVTLQMHSYSKNRECAQNAISFGKDNGTGFIGVPTRSPRRIAADLRYRLEGPLVDGALYLPSEMEEKWALYYHRGKIIFVRSWTRQVEVLAEVQVGGGWAVVGAIQGTFTGEEEPPEFTIRVLDFILRSHALDIVYPAPVPADKFPSGRDAALWCMSMYGRLATLAAADPVAYLPPEKPLRTYSLFHMAAARSELDTMSHFLERGVPPDLPDGDGQSPLHWALSGEGISAAALLLDRGAQVDYRDSEGATMLKQMTQLGETEKAKFLLSRGADPNVADNRGFTALHVAAYLGNQALVALFLHRGANPNLEIEGQTPRSLAASQGHHAVVALLDRWKQ